MSQLWSEDDGYIKPPAFMQAIGREVKERATFVPLLGAGFSANSGIPTASDLRIYLTYCIAKVLEEPRAPLEPFCPRLDAWPDQADAWRANVTEAELLRQPGTNDSDRRKRLIYAASGTRGDWREMLRFLARVDRDGREAFLSTASEGVVDSAFVHLTASRKPNLAHAMLAHLTESLRIRTILTTNFDDLVEAAFDRMAMPLSVFDVHLKAGLPHHRLVLEHRAIVKLHGSRFGLRADESLDSPPPPADLEMFVEYLGRTASPVRLLVMGASGYEPRTIRLLQAASEKLKDRLRIYWVCYRESEPPLLKTLLKDVLKHSQMIATVHRDLGLFLLELYQRVVLSLPPAGADFAALPRVPPYLYTVENTLFDKRTLEKASAQLRSDIESQDKPLIAIGVPNRSGVSLVVSKLFDDLSTSRHCLWFDLADFAQPDEFYAALIQALAEKVATWPGLPLLPQYDARSCQLDSQALVRKSPREFLIVINGREGLGTLADYRPAPRRFIPRARWKEATQDDFWRGLHQLAPKTGMKVIVLWGKRSLKTPFDVLNRGEGFHRAEVPSVLVRRETEAAVGKLVVQRVVELLRKDAREGRRFLRFMHSLLLIRRARHPAAMWSWVLLKAPQPGRTEGDNDEERQKTANEYCDFLVAQGIGGYQPGGAFWMHSGVRRHVLRALKQAFRRVLKSCASESECHQGIADWYVKLFRASNDPAAALESIHHRLSCAAAARKSRLPEQMAVTALVEAVQTLELARDRILSAGYYTAFRRLVKDVEQFFRARRMARQDLAKEVLTHLHRISRDFARDLAKFEDAMPGRHTTITRRPRGPDRRSMNVERLNRLLEHTHRLVGLRSYDQALAKFEEMFAELDLDGVMTAIDANGNIEQGASKRLDDPRSLIDMTRDQAHRWCRSNHSEERRHLAIRAVRRHMFLLMLIGQMHRVLLPPTSAPSPRDGRVSKSSRSHAIEKKLSQRRLLEKKLFVAAEGDYVLATAMMRYCWDRKFLQRENVAIRGHAGVMLATLGRFYEAHRRLNEGWAYQVRSDRGMSGSVPAILDLRRAEVYLRQAQAASSSDQEGAAVRAMAFLDDAKTALARASTRWLAEPVRAWWRTLGCELELAVLHHRSTLMRDVPGKPDLVEIGKLFVEETFRLTNSDLFRLARVLETWSRIGGAADDFRPEWEAAQRIRGRIQPPVAPLVNAYVRRIDRIVG